MTLTKTILFDNDILQIRHVVCNPLERGCTEVEESSSNVMVLPVKGSFMQHFLDGKRIIAEPSQALFFSTGRPFRISHSIAEMDECLAFQFSTEMWNELLQTIVDSESMTGLEAHCLLSSNAIAERSLMFKKLTLGIADDIEMVERSFSLVSSALRSLRKKKVEKRPSRQRRRLQQIETVQIALLKAPGKKLSLSVLADSVSMSPFHLTRIFHQQVGTPLHQYHLRVRIAGAINSLLDTNTELTQIALEYGFSSHSHFTSVFHKMIGMTPDEFRMSANSKVKKETRKNLIAH